MHNRLNWRDKRTLLESQSTSLRKLLTLSTVMPLKPEVRAEAENQQLSLASKQLIVFSSLFSSV